MHTLVLVLLYTLVLYFHAGNKYLLNGINTIYSSVINNDCTDSIINCSLHCI